MGKPMTACLADNSQQWSVVLQAQDALDALATMIEVLGDEEFPVPHTVSAIIRLIGSRLDEPLGIPGVG